MNINVSQSVEQILANYPFGIPTRVLHAVATPPKPLPAQTTDLRLRCIGRKERFSENVWQGAAGELLKAAIEKGLGLTAGTFELQTVTTASALTFDRKAIVALVLGEDLRDYSVNGVVQRGAFGEVVFTEEGYFLRTYCPSEIISNPTLKGTFWNHLKQLKTYLG
jgi:uracil-DNA glycosylase